MPRRRRTAAAPVQTTALCISCGESRPVSALTLSLLRPDEYPIVDCPICSCGEQHAAWDEHKARNHF
jgi:hypothetical protein